VLLRLNRRNLFRINEANPRLKCSATLAPATCPVRAVEAWVELLQTAEGPLFRAVDRQGRIHQSRLTAQSVALVVKRLIAKAGIAGDYAGHSLRAGRSALFSSSAMSSDRLFLERVARQHCPPPVHLYPQNNMRFSNVKVKGDISTLPGPMENYA
jgi:hypothetical protein